ncbi:ASCC2 isoform 11 [Pan troglodytes]|uniref:Activating signal cointegrator 1 complex subunit 2 n=3 Tax=Pan TaxID=9596 RepID=A0A2I3TPW6_PANTR|nr:ASCC2 isoform 11 [Pan troglodytes]
MPALPLDQLQITHKDPKTGKLRTSPALETSLHSSQVTTVTWMKPCLPSFRSSAISSSTVVCKGTGPVPHPRSLRRGAD